jgi:hypothetical protein
MPTLDLHLSSPLHDSFRVRQITGLFDLPLPARNQFHLKATLPDATDHWQIGVILGPSGSGKTTLARHAFPGSLHAPAPWPADRAIIDCFPENLPIKQITRTLTAVGFSSPPSWLKPHAVLSTGEKFRCDLAAAILCRGGPPCPPSLFPPLPPCRGGPPCPPSLFPPRSRYSHPILAVDEFVSPLDSTTARFAARALSRSIRKGSLPIRLIAVTCREDILPHLAPDWVFDTSTLSLTYPNPALPPLDLQVRKSSRADWPKFAPHHYLSHTLHPSALCFTGYIDNQPATFTAVLPFPHPKRPGYREHRTVCLPIYQGVGLGSAMSDYIASLFISIGKPYFSRTSHPAMIQHRTHSPNWKLLRAPGMVSRSSPSSLNTTRMSISISRGRYTAGFEFIGPARNEDARRFGLQPVSDAQPNPKSGALEYSPHPIS